MEPNICENFDWYTSKRHNLGFREQLFGPETGSGLEFISQMRNDDRIHIDINK